MDIEDQYKRHVLYFLFFSAENESLVRNKINSVRKETIISVRTA